VIPVGCPSDKDIVRTFAVDVLIPAAKASELRTFSNSFQQLYWPEMLQQVFPDGPRSKSPTFVDVKRPIAQIREKRDAERAILQHAYLFSPNETDPLRDVLLAMFGGYPSPAEVGVDYGKIYASSLSAEILGPAVLSPEIAIGLTPSDIASWGLKTSDSKFMFEGQNGLFLGSAASFEDLTAFWNLRAAGFNLRFVDRAYDDRLNWITQKWVEYLTQEHKADSGSVAIGVWARAESGFEGSPETGVDSVFRIIDDKFWNRVPTLPHYHWGEQHVLASLAFEPAPEYSFQLPAKPTGEDDEFLQTIGVTVRQHGDLTASAKDTFFVPPLSGLNMFFSRRMYPVAPFSVRIGRESFTLCISSAEASLSIPGIGRSAVISELFKTLGIQADRCQPGVVAERLIHQMGGLRGAGLFRFPGVRRLIEQYTPLQHFTRSNAIECIRDRDPSTGTYRFDDYIPQGSEWSKWDAHFVFDLLLDRRVFRAGLEFQCPNCKLLFWAPIDSIGTEVTCDLCGDKFNCTPQLRNRGDWRFKRSGMFGKDDHQEGSIPVILTLRQLADSMAGISMQPSIFTTAMTLNSLSPGVSIPSCETDFVFVNRSFRGPLNLVIGECKSQGGEISDTDLANLSAVASAVDPAEVKAFLVLAKTGDFTGDEIARCKDCADGLPHRVILLSQRELDTPHFTYEWASREFDVSVTAVTLEAMAMHTEAIFFDPKPKKARD
jgi:hypothetical protein